MKAKPLKIKQIIWLSYIGKIGPYSSIRIIDEMDCPPEKLPIIYDEETEIERYFKRFNLRDSD